MPYTIAFYVHSVPISLDVRDGRAGLGGSESACFGLARALAATGQDVHIHAQRLAPEAVGRDGWGVTWHEAGEHDADVYAWCDVVEPDVFVSLRMAHLYAAPVRARLRCLWNQDLLVGQTGAQQVLATSWQVDRMIYVSDYHRQQWEGVAPDLRGLAVVTRNGFDPAHVPTDVAKVPGRVCYITRPERGLGPLLQMWPALKAAVPHAELHVTRYSSMYDGEGGAVKQMCEAYDRATQAVAEKVGGIVVHAGGLGKADLYRLIASSEVMWYPGVADFAETSCWSPDTPVAVPGGHKRIDQVRAGDLVLSYSEQERRIVAKRVKWCKRTGVNKAVLKLTYKWRFGRRAGRQESIIGTPNHQMLRRDGTWTTLGELRPGDSLMPMFRKSDGKYWEVGHDGKKYRYEHDITGEAIVGRPLGKGEIVHHGDGDGLNNHESNLTVWQQSEHIRHHLPEMKAAYRANRPSFDYEQMYALRRQGYSQSQIAEHMGTYQQDICRKLASANHSVASVEPAGFSDVWDMEVEDTHTFIAGHVVVHNCVAAIEAQACGTVFVGSRKGALPETIPSGTLLEGDALTVEYQTRAIGEVERFLTHPTARNAAVYAGRQHVTGYSYAAIAQSWLAWIGDAFEDRYRDNVRGVLRQLLQYDDHTAAMIVAREDGQDAAAKFCQYVIDGKDQTADDYGTRSQHDVMAEVRGDARLQAAAQAFVEAGCTRVLDVACGNGAFAIALALQAPHVRVVGHDYSAENVARATEAAEAAGVGDRVTFHQSVIYDYDAHDATGTFRDAMTSAAEVGGFDGAFCGEFLEHVANVQAVVETIHTGLTPGGLVVATMPSGPFTEMMPPGVPIRRGHVHAFCYDDLVRIFGTQRDVTFGVLQIPHPTPRGNPVAHWMVSYRTSGAPIGDRDYAHRIVTTRPMPTLTVGMIVGPGSALDLPRCLEYVAKAADEIVIGLCGADERTVAVCASYDVRTLTLPPVADLPGGFAEARNTVLDAATGEWFLWIDADEQLIGGAALRKYLDTSVFDGFILRQNHLQIDAPTFYDEPVRLFRNTGRHRFYGVVHEQPQKDGPNGDIWPTLAIMDVQIAHYGYLTDGVRRRKSQDRNLALLVRDRQVHPDRRLGTVLWLREFATWLAEIGQHRPTYTDCLQRIVNDLGPDALAGLFDGPAPTSGLALARHGAALYERAFPDPADKLAGLARPFYEACLRVLPEAWEVAFAFAGRQGGMKGAQAKPGTFWTRSWDDVLAVLRARTKPLEDAFHPTPIHTDPYPGESEAA